MKGSHMVKSKKILNHCTLLLCCYADFSSLASVVMLLCWFFIYILGMILHCCFISAEMGDTARLGMGDTFIIRALGMNDDVSQWFIYWFFHFLLVLLHSLLKSYMIFTFLNVSCIHFSGFVFVRNILRYFTYLFIHELKQLHEYVFSSNFWRKISF